MASAASLRHYARARGRPRESSLTWQLEARVSKRFARCGLQMLESGVALQAVQQVPPAGGSGFERKTGEKILRMPEVPTWRSAAVPTARRCRCVPVLEATHATRKAPKAAAAVRF